MTRILLRSGKFPGAAVMACAGALVLGPSFAEAAGGAFAADAQGYAVEGGRSVKTASAIGVLAGPAFDVSVALSRIEDSIDGSGYAAGAGGSFGLASMLSLRGGVTRTLRSSAPDAWSFRLGPEVHVGGATLGASLFRTHRGDGLVTRGALADVEQPLGARFTAHVGGSFARTGGDPDAQAGELGARWNAIGPLHLLADVGLAHDPGGALSGGSGGGGGGGPLGGIVPGLGQGQGASPTGSNGTSAAHLTARLGVRIILP